MQTLLFIDDEEGVRRSLKRALKHEPYRTRTASSGRDGIDYVAANTQEVAAVISDYRMPGLDGLETLTFIGAINPEITRIILTGYATMEAAIQATNAGIDGFLTKPFNNNELRAKIHEIWVHKHLKQFVCEQVYAEIDRSPGALKPRLQEVTVLFCDIRDFTGISRRIAPDALVDLLNGRFFSPMGEIVYRHQGTMDKHIGDSMMVVFGAPLARPDDPLRAVRCAVAMQEKARQIDAELRAAGDLRLQIGIGIATGLAFSGIMGSLRKKEYTSVGMPVNIAARLQGLAKGGEILLDQATRDLVATAMAAEALPPVTVKGMDAPIPVHRIRPGRAAGSEKAGRMAIAI